MVKNQIRAARRAFTLIELMIVVAIIAVLATVAIGAYGRQVKRARLNDMRAVVQHIAAQQEVFLGFNGRYARSAASAFCPAAVAGSSRPFNVTSCGNADVFADLAVRLPGTTFFQYTVLAGTPAAGDDCAVPAGVNMDATEVCGRIDDDTHWYVIIARGDQDSDGDFSEFVTDSTMSGLILERDSIE